MASQQLLPRIALGYLPTWPDHGDQLSDLIAFSQEAPQIGEGTPEKNTRGYSVKWIHHHNNFIGNQKSTFPKRQNH